MDKNKTIIIAEIGGNHNGDMNLARKLIYLANECGADLAKLQLYDTDKLIGSDKLTRSEELVKIIRDGELSKEQAKILFGYGKGIGIEVFFSVFTPERVEWCEEIGVKRYKIACTFRDEDTLRAVEETGKPVIISNGEDSIGIGTQTTNLYCVPKYPASLGEVNFDKIREMGGFSDHTVGIEAAKMAIDSGVGIIEKHFIIDRNTGIDAPWGICPDELRELVKYAR